MRYINNCGLPEIKTTRIINHIHIAEPGSITALREFVRIYTGDKEKIKIPPSTN